MSENKHTPGPWTVGYRALTVQAPSEKGGTFPVCDIRGWGYLTGKGSGALGLEPEVAEAVQTANAALIAAAPDMLEALIAVHNCGNAGAKLSRVASDKARAAIKKARGIT